MRTSASNLLISLLACICSITFVAATCRSNSKFARTNNDDLQRCLSTSLPSTVRTIYPCKTSENQKTSAYQCDHFNVSELSSVRGGRIRHSPAVVVYVTDASDVQNVVKCAARLNYIVNALGGGHSYEGYGLGSMYNNIIINMAAINYTRIDQREKTGTFGAGARLGPIYYRTYEYENYTVNAGSCPWVGLAGHALGGGYGLLARLHGLLSDRVLEMKGVNAQGELSTINETHEPQLCWALRGGGGGLFVIVTEFKIRLVRSPSLVTNFSASWYLNMTKLVIQRYQSLIFNDRLLNLSHSIYVTVSISSIQVALVIISLGTEFEEFHRTVSLFLTNLPTPSETHVYAKDWLSFVYEGLGMNDGSSDNRGLLLDNLTLPTYYFKAKHLFYNQPMTDRSLDQFIDQLKLGGCQLHIAFHLWDGYLSRIPANQTAFPHRHMKFGIQLMIYWNDTREEAEQIDRLNRIYLTLYKDSTKSSYINYIDRDVQSWMKVYYHTHRERLRKIQHIYDQDNRFHFEKTVE